MQTCNPPDAVLADIGGTNARFALLDGRELSQIEHLSVVEHATAYDALSAALEQFGLASAPPVAVLGFAGPVSSERAFMTNTGWETLSAELRRRFGFARVRLMNDYEALALGLDQFTQADRQTIGPELESKVGTLAVVGPGSGLGVAALIPGQSPPTLLIGEGGHSSMPASDHLEAEILNLLRTEFGHVSAERVLSGPGLANLYKAIATIAQRPIEALDPSDVTRQGLEGSDEVCRLALKYFCRFLGSFAGNMALCYGAQAGVYLAGGILPRFPDFLAASEFRERFEHKGRLSEYLSRIPTWLITRPDAAFAGLAVAAGHLE